MIKTLLFTFLTSLFATSQDKPNTWICDLDTENTSHIQNQIVFSLQDPTLIRVKTIPQEDGSSIIKNEYLITKSQLSSWKMDKTKCLVDSKYQQHEKVDTFDFVFSCGPVKGTFKIDFNSSQGLYYEEFTPQNISRTFAFKDCRPKAELL